MTIKMGEELKSLAYARNRWIQKNDDGKTVSQNTVARWTLIGILTPDGKRIRLDVHYRGNMPMTSRQEVERFFAAITAARRKHAIEKANDRELATGVN